MIRKWADTPDDLRRRRLGVAGDVEEVIVSDETGAASTASTPRLRH